MLRLCEYGGVVVNGDRPIPTDASEYAHPAVNVIIGCNRLRCKTCGEWVRHGPRGLIGTDDVSHHLDVLYATEEWANLPFLEQREAPYRLYACRCTVWLEDDAHRIVDPDPDLDTPHFPWLCQGHSLPMRPVTVGETTISADTDFEVLVDKILSGWSPFEPVGLKYDGPVYWLTRLYAYLYGLPEANSLSKEVSRRVDQAEPETLGRVLLFFKELPKATGAGAIVKAISDRVEKSGIGYGLPEAFEPPTAIDVIVSRIKQGLDRRNVTDKTVLSTFKETLLLRLSDLSNEIIGETEADRMRARLPDGFDDSMVVALAQGLEQERSDLPLKALLDLNWSVAFDEEDLLWLANQIVPIEKAGNGRWKPILESLVDLSRIDLEAFGPLVLIAGTRIIQSDLVALDEIRNWIEATGKSDEVWVLPLVLTLNTQAMK